MTIHDLNREELTEVKLRMYNDAHPEGVSLYEMSIIDELVSDEEVYAEYGDTEFTKDDFFCRTAELNRWILLYIDALSDGENWYWNDFHPLRTVLLPEGCEAEHLRSLVKNPGEWYVDDQDEVIELRERETDRPVLALQLWYEV